MRLLFLALGSLLLLLLPRPGHAQWAITSWIDTRLDEHTTLQLPYLAEPEPVPGVKGSRQFTTDTENIILLASSIDLRYQPGYNPNGTVTAESLSRYFDRLIRANQKAFRALQIELLAQDNVVFAGSPARAARFSCFDEVRQQPAYVDFIYAWRGEVLYMFACLYRRPETAATLADKKRFLESVRFDPKAPAAREL
jgi:hypothetical protein